MPTRFLKAESTVAVGVSQIVDIATISTIVATVSVVVGVVFMLLEIRRLVRTRILDPCASVEWFETVVQQTY